MAAGRSLVHDLIDRVSSANHASWQRLRDLKSQDYPSSVGPKVVGLLLSFHEVIEGVLSRLRTTITPVLTDSEALDKEITIRRYGHLVYNLHALLELVGSARVEYVSPSTVVLVDRLSTALQDAKFLIIPEFRYNFSYVELLGKLQTLFEYAIPLGDPARSEVIALLEGFAGSLAIVRFPHAERTSILLNTMLAHEIGHALSQQSRLAESIASEIHVDADLVDRLLDKVLEATVPGAKSKVDLLSIATRETIQAALIRQILDTVGAWVEELTCDAIAFGYLGPAYLLSFLDFSLSQEGLDEPSETHPPVRMRLNLLLALMQALGFATVLATSENQTLKAVHQRIQEIADLLKRRKPEQRDEIIVPALEGVQHVIVARVLDTLGDAKYLPDLFQQDVPLMCEALDRFVPPCVKYDFTIPTMIPADVISILNAGICYRIAHMDKVYQLFAATSYAERQRVDVKYNDLVLKAIELSSAFGSARGTIGVAT